jgi:hypothetical protein
VLAKVGQVGHTTGWCSLGLARATRWCGPLVAPHCPHWNSLSGMTKFDGSTRRRGGTCSCLGCFVGV